MTTTIAKLIARNVSPTFAHDCPHCLFLGTLDGCDLYYCPRTANRFGEICYRHGNDGPAYGALPLNLASACRGDGSPYSLILALVDRFAASGHPSAWTHEPFTPNAYATPDGRWAPPTGEGCGGCEGCDGENACDAERIWKTGLAEQRAAGSALRRGIVVAAL